jgi:broad specificity phosphatase PhoE
LETVGVPRDKVALVINRRAPWGVSSEEIAETLGFKPIAVIPDAPKAWEAARMAHRVVALGAHPGPWRALYAHLTGLPAPTARRARFLPGGAKRRPSVS